MSPVGTRIVVMGVSGSGKSTIGALLAERLDLVFVDGDDLHSAVNRAKMGAGRPLTDDDRWAWLDRVGEALAAVTGGAVVSCSALKRSYRDRLRAKCVEAWFVQLNPSESLATGRLDGRTGHFMPTALLDSQFGILERLQRDEDGVTIDPSGTPGEIVNTIIGLEGES